MRNDSKYVPQLALLGAMLIFLVGSGLSGPLLTFTADNAMASLSGDSLKGKVVDSIGTPIAGAQVQLLSPAKTMMDVTVSAKDGSFTLDLGVLDAKEMKKLNTFFIVVNKKGKKVKKSLESGASSANGIVRVEDIELH
jgi:hypothetical protein